MRLSFCQGTRVLALGLGLVLPACREPTLGQSSDEKPVMNESVDSQTPQPPTNDVSFSDTKAPPARTNRLAAEKSPYLLQHQHNPVDWYPWGEEAFEKARREDKPIFLSIGYSTCHWCHVMERESFETEEVASVLNKHFVSIKVDREERPDVDKIYMTFVQGMTGSGGWPLNVFLTPELKPYYGGTYWPPQSRYGRPGFVQVLEQAHAAWQDRRVQIMSSSADLHQRLLEMVRQTSEDARDLTTNTLSQAASRLKQPYDPAHGGFGGAPKFPTPSYQQFLLRHGVQFGDEEAVRMILRTCEKMAAGGIYDQIGGGFSRYSVDAQWLVPHFEKMLYDNAQLLQLYLDAYLASGRDHFADVARDILRYVLRDMTSPEGGFYSAEDADSEGHEGKFYCWTRAELESLLSADEFAVVARYYGVTEKGNFEDHSHPQPLANQNVLSVVDADLSVEERLALESARQKIFDARAKRVRPHLDDKVLATWNGLMLGAMARAAVVLRDETYLRAAEKNLAFLRAKLWEAGTRTLYNRWRDGERDSVQLQESYAFLLNGTLDLYEATLNPDHLQFALDLAGSMMERFYDSEQGGFWQSLAGNKDLIVRIKEDYDGAEPSGNSVAVLALLRLSAMTDRDDFKQAAERTLRLFSSRLAQAPSAMPYMLMSLTFSLENPWRLVLSLGEGKPADGPVRAILAAAHGVLQPHKVVLSGEGPVEEFARTLPAQDGQPTAYICSGTACLPPTRDPARVKELLGKSTFK